MFYAYVIKSIEHDFLYKGHCEDLEKRLQQHNLGMTKSIQKYIPFKLVYFESFTTREEAIVREKYFKTSAGRRFLKQKNCPVVQCPPGRTELQSASNSSGRSDGDRIEVS